MYISSKIKKIIITYTSAPMSPLSSMGSPITFIMRPRVLGPTGTLIAVPVSRQP